MRPWYAIDDAHRVHSPAILVYPDRIESNLRQLIDTVGDPSRLRPHVKPHKMPTIVQMQLAMGITRFKASTIAEAEMTAMAGGEDVLLAYQPVGPNRQRLIRLIDRYRDTRFATIVDDASCIGELNAAAAALDAPLRVYLDIDVGMHRTGIEVDGAPALFEHLIRCEHLQPVGLHAYEGHLDHRRSRELAQAVREAFDPLWELRRRLLNSGATSCDIVAGGTPTLQALSHHALGPPDTGPPLDLQIAAGTVVLWDTSQDDLSPPGGFTPAAAMLTRVISRPARGLLCLDLGLNAISTDSGHPRLDFLDLPDAQIERHNEEHLVVRTRHADQWPIGSVLYALPRQICPTIALHTEVGVVQDYRLVDRWMVLARERRLSI